MSGPNGPDIAAVYQLLTQVARTVTGHDRKLDDLSAEVAGLREVVAAHDRKLDDLSSGLALLRDAGLRSGRDGLSPRTARRKPETSPGESSRNCPGSTSSVSGP